MNRINQITVFFGCQFLLGACIAISPYQFAIAQIVVDTLPTPPQLNKSNESQVVDEVFIPRDLDFRVPESPIAQKVDSYLVYINDINSTGLEQVKQAIPTAFRREHQGETVIQAGVFSKESNAVSLAQKLRSLGIPSHIFNLTTAQEVALTTNKSQVYSVVVPE